MTDPKVQVIVLAYGAEEYLGECVAAVLASADASGVPLDLALTVVDNGAAAAVDALPDDPRMRVLRPPRNLGFAGGCNYAAARSPAQTLVFANSDAIVAPTAIDRLCAALTGGVDLVSGSIRLADDPDRMNTAGNPVHYLGASWAGGLGDLATAHEAPADITSITGALFAVGREHWTRLGGFDELYFAYHEDADLSLRTWLSGGRVQFVPDAIAVHHYEFSRTPTKFYLLERNRWITVATDYPTPVLLAAFPMLVGFELGMMLVAARFGLFREKLRGYRWLIAHAGDLRRRRRTVQATRTITPARFAALLSSRLEPQVLGEVPGLNVFNSVVAGYWSLARRLAGLNPRGGTSGASGRR